MIIIDDEPFGTGERISYLMSKKGGRYRQEDLAEALDVDSRSVRRWINEGVFPSRNINKLAEVLDCDPDYLRCKQNTPRKSKEHKRIKLSELSIVDRYLPKIRDLMKTTVHNFSYGYDCSFEEVEDYFIDGDKKYKYIDAVPDYSGKVYYSITVNGSRPIRKSEEEMEVFVKGIMKYISFEISQLKED